MASGKIMIVEDEGLVAEDLRSTLTRWGYQVVGVADSFDAARSLADSAAPDLALLDIRLKGPRDGIELAHELRRRNIGFVYLTSHADDGTLARAEVTEPLGYVLKPFGEREMMPVLQTALYRHTAELRQRNIELWLRTTLRSIGDGVFVTDEKARITYVNPVGERLARCAMPDVLGLPLVQVLPIRFESDGLVVECVATTAIERCATMTLAEGAFLTFADGTTLPIEDSAAPILDGEGIVTGAVVVVRDATARREAENERRRSEERLQQARQLESLGVLASGLAHDLNNILTAILGNVELCRYEASSTGLGPLAEIEANANAAADLCRRMVSGAEHGALAPTAVDLGEVIRDCIARERALATGNTTFELTAAQPGIDVLADPVQLRQVVQNLLRNAVEAMGSQGGRVSVRLGTLHLPVDDPDGDGKTLRPGDYAWFHVADEGPGMPPEVRARVFEPFFTTKFTGRGLGLASVHGILRRHGGTITVGSESGRGAVFRVVWPAAPLANRARPTNPPMPAAGQDLTVLVVDDELSVQQVTCELLRSQGCTCHAASGGHEALARLHNGLVVDAVILDVMMPGMTGIETFQRLRAAWPHLPVLLVSGVGIADAAVLRGGRVSFLSKPYPVAELMARIRALIAAPV